MSELLLLLACAGPPSADEPATCNGHASLCDRSYAEVAQVAAHNAMSSVADGWLLPNQTHDVPRQLEDGVRGLMLDVYEWEGDAWLCHAACEAGSQRLVEGLGEIGDFLDAHPTEIVTLILESYLDAESTVAAFADAGLLPMLVEHPQGDPWPSLAELAAANRRLVVFTDNEPDAFPGYLDEWTQAWQNPYHTERGDTFSCEFDRGNPDSTVFILNHFLTDPWATPELAAEANTWDSLGEHALRCANEGSPPTFVTVDFYDLGVAFEVVDDLNGIADRQP